MLPEKQMREQLAGAGSPQPLHIRKKQWSAVRSSKSSSQALLARMNQQK